MSQAGCLRLVVSERWVIVSGWLSHGQVKMVLWWREKFGVHSIVYLNYNGIDADAPLARLLALLAASALPRTNGCAVDEACGIRILRVLPVLKYTEYLDLYHTTVYNPALTTYVVPA